MSVTDKVLETVAKAFGTDASALTLETSLLDDLRATSVNYFPIMSELEEEYDLDLQYQTFRSQCRTIGDIVRMVEAEI